MKRLEFVRIEYKPRSCKCCGRTGDSGNPRSLHISRNLILSFDTCGSCYKEDDIDLCPDCAEKMGYVREV